MKNALLSFSFIIMIATGCKEPFNQKTPANSVDYLIVEGILNTAGVTNISLTRTLKLSDKLAVKGEVKATVQVEGQNSGIYPIAEKSNGLYSAAQLNLNPSQKYRLRIKTAGGKTYLSDYVAVKNTPQIDSISWRHNEKGVDIYANAHDVNNGTRYYQWSYEEDWELNSVVSSLYIVTQSRGGSLSVVDRPRSQTEMMKICYRSTKSSVISIFSTAKLTNDIVYEFPLQHIPNGSDKFEVKYTMLVKQFALSKEAFEYLTAMKKNSESGGSLFEAQPSELKGNIHNAADPNEVVIGFVQAAPVLEKRIWIMPSQVPKWKPSLGCSFIEVRNNPDSLAVHFSSDDIGPILPTYGLEFNSFGGVAKIGGATAACVDCRLRGGTNIKPSFW